MHFSPEGVGRGDDTVGNTHRTQISQFDIFELILLLKLDKLLPVDQFEATASQSTVPSPLLGWVFAWHPQLTLYPHFSRVATKTQTSHVRSCSNGTSKGLRSQVLAHFVGPSRPTLWLSANLWWDPSVFRPRRDGMAFRPLVSRAQWTAG